MSIVNIRKLATALGRPRTEMRIRHRDHSCGTHGAQYVVSIIDEGQTAGACMVEEAAADPNIAIDFVEKALRVRLKELLRDHEEHAARYRKVLDETD